MRPVQVGTPVNRMEFVMISGDQMYFGSGRHLDVVKKVKRFLVELSAANVSQYPQFISWRKVTFQLRSNEAIV